MNNLKNPFNTSLFKNIKKLKNKINIYVFSNIYILK